jgi:hypothetical protein
MLSVTYAECHIYALYVECNYAEYRYAECRYAECHGPVTVGKMSVCQMPLGQKLWTPVLSTFLNEINCL